MCVCFAFDCDGVEEAGDGVGRVKKLEMDCCFFLSMVEVWVGWHEVEGLVWPSFVRGIDGSFILESWLDLDNQLKCWCLIAPERVKWSFGLLDATSSRGSAGS